VDRLAVTEIPIEKIHPNPWNPNKLTERQLEALQESILEYGFIAAATVRQHPTFEGEYEIIDSEHRYEVVSALIENPPPTEVEIHKSVRRIIELRILPCFDMGVVPDQQAKRLTVTLNETRGKADTVDLARLLHGLRSEMSLEEIGKGLPYTPEELGELTGLADFDWDTFGSQSQHPGGGEGEGEGDDDEVAHFTVALPGAAYEVVTQARASIEHRLKANGDAPLHKDKDWAWGQVLEYLAAEYLATTPDEPDE
jgi:hypothetical protein